MKTQAETQLNHAPVVEGTDARPIAAMLAALRDIYIFAGVPPQHALRSALADYHNGFGVQST